MRGHRPDYILGLSVIILLIIGLVIMYSISPILTIRTIGGSSKNYYFNNQLITSLIGISGMLLLSRFNYIYLRKLALPFMLIAVTLSLLLLVPFLALESKGAVRWISFGFVSMQPAEVLKLALVIYLAAWFEKKSQLLSNFSETVVPFGVTIGFLAFMVAVLQKDFGTTIVIVGLAAVMYFIAGAPLKHIGLMGGVGLVSSLVLILPFAHRVNRIKTFLDTSADTQSLGYQVNQALITIGSGGLVGVGLGKSLQIHGYVPEAANDSIYAILGEQFGLVGTIAILLIFAYIAYRGFLIAKNAPNQFSRLLAAGITSWITIQAFVNISANVGLIPLTGIPLPFISFGGTAMVATLAGVGILLNISRYTEGERVNANSSGRRRNRWPYLTGSSSLR